MIKRDSAEMEEKIRDLVKYDKHTGSLTWAIDRKGRAAGSVVGGLNKEGYLSVRVLGYDYLCHRIAWLLATGSWPKSQIDHINGNRSDNRLCNLREVTHRINGENRRGPQSNNSTGVLGATLTKGGRYQAKIKANGRSIYLGLFDTAELAGEAYLKAKRKLHEGCTI